MLLLKTLLSHYRRHWLQAIFLLVGIIIANVLLVGTLLINAQARASYADGEQVLSIQPVASIVSSQGARTIPERDYIALRRQGFSMLAPVLRRFIASDQGDILELLGIDLLAMPRPKPEAMEEFPASGTELNNRSSIPGFASFSLPPYSLWGSPARLKQLGWDEGIPPALENGQFLPAPVAVTDQGLGHRLLLDIGVLQLLTGSANVISEILVFESSPAAISALQSALPTHLKWQETRNDLDPAQLTQSFHLNLAAMGMLAFVVGVFLVYNALAFSYTDRHELLRKLRLAGATHAELARSLLLELLVFVAVGTLVGFILGSWLAVELLPGVGQTLAQLYGVYIDYPDSLLSGGLGLPLLMTAIAVGLCVLFPLRQALNMPVLERQSSSWQLKAAAKRDSVLLIAGACLLLLSAFLAFTASVMWLALICMAALLLGAALCLPAILRLLLSVTAKILPHSWARTSWLLADSRWLLGPAALALMAITLALVSNSGLNNMIGSFRQATEDWLQQRLIAEIYIAAEISEPELQTWLARRAPEISLARRYTTRLTVDAPKSSATPIEVISIPGNERFMQSVALIQQQAGAKNAFADGTGVFISERAMRLGGWQPGYALMLCPEVSQVPVLGVYRDYGNPQSQWMLSEKLFRTCWPDKGAASYGLIGPAQFNWPDLRTDLMHDFNLQDNEVINQQELMERALAVFDRTFTVTQALNALTLLVACIGIFCAISAIHHHRVPQQALLTALGLSRRERATLLLVQWGLLGLFCIVLVWPFGALLAWVLAAVVTPVAFGWSFALQADWNHLPMLALLACGSLMCAVLLPSIRLLKASPGQLLRERST
ncbi:MAG: ABC transporter permease [Xanthomonadales bacterium]|nr:ABC transporter permease [Xanthomonadales bacterium]